MTLNPGLGRKEMFYHGVSLNTSYYCFFLNRENICRESLLLFRDHTGREEEIAFSLLASCLES